jgi:hypothetical protein
VNLAVQSRFLRESCKNPILKIRQLPSSDNKNRVFSKKSLPQLLQKHLHHLPLHSLLEEEGTEVEKLRGFEKCKTNYIGKNIKVFLSVNVL